MALTASGGVLSLGANNVVFVVVSKTTMSPKNSNYRIQRSSSSVAEEVIAVASPFSVLSSLGCCRGVTPKTRGVVVAASAAKAESVEADSSACGFNLSRRGLILAAGLVAMVRNGDEAARAGVPSYRKFVDRLDGYAFSYPSAWIQVRGAGADVFFRDPVNLDENVLVEMSSPSSSKFKGVEDLGTPEQAAKQVLQQQLTEFMSTRIGVRREAAVTDARARRGDDGRLYYEVEVTASSYANNNQLAVMPGDRIAKLEWSRRYLSVLGVENNRLYQMRLQVPEKVADLEQQDLRRIMESFKVLTIEA